VHQRSFSLSCLVSLGLGCGLRSLKSLLCSASTTSIAGSGPRRSASQLPQNARRASSL
jgi:hypothetical protein